MTNDPRNPRNPLEHARFYCRLNEFHLNTVQNQQDKFADLGALGPRHDLRHQNRPFRSRRVWPNGRRQIGVMRCNCCSFRPGASTRHRTNLGASEPQRGQRVFPETTNKIQEAGAAIGSDRGFEPAAPLSRAFYSSKGFSTA